MSNSSDGYVKYTVEHTITPAMDIPHWAEINDARTQLYQMGLVGGHPNGVGFGNISVRLQGNEFIISGTATGALPVLDSGKFCLIKSFDLEKNYVVAMGPVKPSAESMTHGAVYKSSSGANCVIHIHSRRIFDGMVRDCCSSTPGDATYGSPEIALAVEKCIRELGKDEGRIVMLGHDEGVIAYGPSVERAFALVQELYDKYRGS